MEKIKNFLFKILQEQKDYIIFLTWLIIYFPLFSLYKISFFLLFLTAIVDFLSERVKKKLLQEQQEKYFVPIFERIFALFPYFLMFFTLMSTLTTEAIYLFTTDTDVGIRTSTFFITVVFPGIEVYHSLIGKSSGLEGLFSFYFEFYYIGRNKKGFSYFIRYQYVFAMLTTQVFGFTCLMLRNFKRYNGENFPMLVETISLTVFICFLILICFCVIKTIEGKQPILPFFDLAVQYQIGIREKEDESFIDIQSEENEDQEG